MMNLYRKISFTSFTTFTQPFQVKTVMRSPPKKQKKNVVLNPVETLMPAKKKIVFDRESGAPDLKIWGLIHNLLYFSRCDFAGLGQR